MARDFTINQISSSNAEYLPQIRSYTLNSSLDKSILKDFKGTVYDSGGSGGNYSINEKYYFVIRSDYGVEVQLYGNISITDLNDVLRVYTANDQSSLDSPITLDALGNITTSGFNQVFSTNGSYSGIIGANSIGGYVVTWYSDNSNVSSGFKLDWTINNIYTKIDQIPYNLSVPSVISLRNRSSSYKVLTSK